jgi:glycosyltransferase involved in cell wall biosynthesis
MQHDKPSIVFLCSRLDLPGGTERAIANTANLLQSKGHVVSILVLDETASSFYPLHDALQVVQRDLNFGLTSRGNVLTRKIAFGSHVRQLKKLLNRIGADIIISTDYRFTIAAWLAVGKENRKIFAWEHHHFHWLQKSRFWNYLYKKTYTRIHSVVALNKTEQQLFRRFGCRSVVIPNFVASGSWSGDGSHFLLSVGWLIKRKGVDLIPGIAQQVFAKMPDWKWIIVGSGDEHAWLQNQVNEKNLGQHVTIVDPVSPDLTEAYTNASIYVMTSRFECFPMVLLEAMSFGRPCISFDCPTGPADIIENGVDGILVDKEDTVAMAAAIIALMKDAEKRKSLGRQAAENVKRFSPEAVYPLWESLFDAE